MKWWVVWAVVGSVLSAPAPEISAGTWDLIDLAAISRMTPQQLEKLAEGLAVEEMIRTKRSSALAGKVTSGISSKVGLLGQASSFVSAASAPDHHHTYSYEPHEEEKKVDFWGLKKSILNTLFQAVKAITGGVTIIKGQLIKGGGALAAVAGKLISKKGDVVSNLGKKIVNSAVLVPPKKHHIHSHAPVYGPPAHDYGPPPTAYGAPSGPAHYSPSASGFSSPGKYTSHYEDYVGGQYHDIHYHEGVEMHHY